MIRRIIKKRRPIYKNCQYCQEKKNPDYKEPESLRRFTSESGRILTQEIGGLCAKHQRRLSKEIKRARHLALLAFVNKS